MLLFFTNIENHFRKKSYITYIISTYVIDFLKLFKYMTNLTLKIMKTLIPSMNCTEL